MPAVEHPGQEFQGHTELLEFDRYGVQTLRHRNRKFPTGQKFRFLSAQRCQCGICKNARQTLLFGGIQRQVEKKVFIQKAGKQPLIRNRLGGRKEFRNRWTPRLRRECGRESGRAWRTEHRILQAAGTEKCPRKGYSAVDAANGELTGATRNG